MVSLALPCKKMCGHNLKRFHFSCLFCRYRTNRLAKPGYYRAILEWRIIPYPKGPLIAPENSNIYILLIDNNRRFKRVKSVILKRLLTLAEWMSC